MPPATHFPDRNPNPVLQLAEDGTVLYANPASGPLLAQWDTAVGEPLPEAWGALAVRVLASGESESQEVLLGERVIYLSFAPLSDLDRVNVYGLDITGRKAMEASLRESEETNRMLLESAPDGIVIVDAQGRIVLVNSRAEAMFGYRREELLGRSIGTLVPDAVREVHAAYCSGYVDNPHVRSMGQGLDLRARRKDGSEFPAEISLGFVPTRSGLLAMSFILDVTQRKRAEDRQAVLLQELKSANQELRDFAYVVSHDLKAPLRAISSLAQWLRQDYAAALDEDGQELIALLLARVQRMHNLIEGVLQYSRVGRIREQLTEVDMNRLVADVVDSLAPPPHVQVRMETPLPTCVCEKTRVAQIFQNLIGNAIKYMDKPRGEVRVAAEDAGDGFWRFSVADNGPGIDEQYFDKVFQLFQTLQSRDEMESTGVGLAVVKKAVELYKGRVWLESRVGEGSTFYFTLPQRPDVAAEDSSAD